MTLSFQVIAIFGFYRDFSRKFQTLHFLDFLSCFAEYKNILGIILNLYDQGSKWHKKIFRISAQSWEPQINVKFQRFALKKIAPSPPQKFLHPWLFMVHSNNIYEIQEVQPRNSWEKGHFSEVNFDALETSPYKKSKMYVNCKSSLY